MNKIILEIVEHNELPHFSLVEGDNDLWETVAFKLGSFDGHDGFVPIGSEKQMNQMLKYYEVDYIEVI